MGQDIVIWGASGHARVAADILRLCGWNIIGFLDDISPERMGTRFLGAEILGGWRALESIPANSGISVALAVGDNKARLDRYREARSAGYHCPPITHPSAVIAADAVIGAGTLLGAGAVVGPNSRIGEATIINTSASVDHDCRVSDGVHIAPGVRVAGKVTIGERSLLGVGANVIDGIQIGADCTLGAGSVLLTDLFNGSVAYGVPATIVANGNTR